MVFGRKKVTGQDVEGDTSMSIDGDEDAQAAPGPRDSGGEPAPRGYLDLGALYVPTIPGMQLRAQFEADKTTLRRVLLVTGTSGIQVSIVAAPRSGGLWPDLSQQIMTSIKQEGGEVEIETGRYGEELVARIAMRLPGGAVGYAPARIVGIEGPRWLMRVDIQGAAAAGDESQLASCHEIIDQLIVNRGSEPRVRLEMLPLRLPKGAMTTDGTV